MIIPSVIGNAKKNTNLKDFIMYSFNFLVSPLANTFAILGTITIPNEDTIVNNTFINLFASS